MFWRAFLRSLTSPTNASTPNKNYELCKTFFPAKESCSAIVMKLELSVPIFSVIVSITFTSSNATHVFNHKACAALESFKNKVFEYSYH